jgi:hypothetical protein
MAKWDQRGDSKLGCVVSLVLLALAIVIAVKAVPVRVAVADLEDFCVREAEHASLRHEFQGRTPEQQITDEILIEAQKENLPVSRDHIKVWRDTQDEHIQVTYNVVIDFLVYKYNWHVVHSVDRPLF